MGNSNYFFPLSLRVLPPAGGYPSPFALFNTCRRIKQIAKDKHERKRSQAIKELHDEICTQFSAEQVYFFGSGKEALYELFLTAKKITGKDLIALSAYSCPDIATAAIKAGCRVLPVDVSPFTLEMDTSTIEENLQDQIAAVVLSNLYGLPDSLEPFKRENWLLVDDGCQALLSDFESGHVGCRPATIGVVSFGRGKAICGIGGGGIIVGQHSYRKLAPNAVVSELTGQVEKQSSGNLTGNSLEFFKANIFSLFEHPLLFRLPASMPFLGLGETKVKSDFECSDISYAQAVCALSFLEKTQFIGKYNRHNALLWNRLLDGFDVIQPFVERDFVSQQGIVPIRYPVIFREASQRREALRRLAKRGLGVSSSYPLAIGSYPELESNDVVNAHCPNAEDVAQKILTLPVHGYLKSADAEETAHVIKQVI